MAKCINHPDRDALNICSKHAISFCDECVHCIDPELYCKFRSSCPVWFVHKEKMREERQKKIE